jgi:hypothetical protein
MTPRIRELYYITHIDNIPSILKLGVLSHEEMQKRNVPYRRIYDEQIISNRKNRTTPDSKSLWAYANLYFQPRNPMLYRVACELSAESIAVLAMDLDVLKLPGGFITNGNAASPLSDIIPAEEWLKTIGQLTKILTAEYWTDEDGSKRKIMAECLLPVKISPDYIKTIYVANDTIAHKVRKDTVPEISVIPEPHIFFENPLVTKLTPDFSLVRGDMFFSRMHTLTVSVNIVGIMGKGLASRAKYQFPDVYVVYQDLCRQKILRRGRPVLYKREISLDTQLADEPLSMKNGNGATWFLLFPTKNHWRENADFSGIENGMQWLLDNHQKEGIQSLALPALGCGLGNLKWQDVGPMLCKYLYYFKIPVQLYLPAETQIPEHYLKKEFLLSLV